VGVFLTWFLAGGRSNWFSMSVLPVLVVGAPLWPEPPGKSFHIGDVNLRGPQVTTGQAGSAWSLLQRVQDCADREPKAHNRGQ
jgi:hypothetical protein